MTDPMDPAAPRRRDEVERTTVIEEEAVWYEQPWMIAGIVLLVILLILLAWLLLRDDGAEVVLSPTPSPTPTVTTEVTVTPTPAVTPTPSPSPTPTPTPVPVETVTVPPDETITEPAPEPVQLSGSGSETTQAFEHTGGLAIVRYAHDGDSFTVTLVEDGGDEVESFTANAEQGSRGFALDEGTYRIQVDADGTWDLAFEQPRFVEGGQLPKTIEGNADTATDPFEVPEARVRFEFEHEEADSLEVRVLHAETGEVEAEFTARSGQAVEADLAEGLYILDVQATDLWRAVLS